MRISRIFWIGFASILALLALIFWGNLTQPKRSAQAAQPLASAGNGIDLDVTYIGRAPLYQPYCVEYPFDLPAQPGIPRLCAGTENDRRWPEPGEIVTFTGHIRNQGNTASPPFTYTWEIDGASVYTGILASLEAGAEITVTYTWPWAHGLSADGQRALDDHTVGLRVDPEQAIIESYESNNHLVDATRALSFIIYITPEMYAAYQIPVAAGIPASTEDWIQKQVAAMNGAFAQAVYPVTPQGAALRVRVNKIELVGSYPGWDGLHDGSWFFQDEVRHTAGYYDPETDIDWGLPHEWGHQASLIDLYAVGVTPMNVFPVDRYDQTANMGFGWPFPGIMFGGDSRPHYPAHVYSSHSAGGAHSMAGYRNGYYGVYLYDIPSQNFLQILDIQGNPAAGVQVSLYQREGWWDWSGQMSIDAQVDISGATDSAGNLFLTNRSALGGTVTLNGHILQDNPFGVVDIIGDMGLFLIHLQQGEHEEFHWLDITEFNLAYWQGDTISHTFTIYSHVPGEGAPQAPITLPPLVEGNRVTICWQPVSGATAYQVYRARPLQFRYERLFDTITQTCIQDDIEGPYPFGGNIYAITSLDSQGRESGFSRLTFANDLVHPLAVLIGEGAERLVLDPQIGGALLRQDGEGFHLQNVGPSHPHLENSHFFTRDANGRLLFSHPGDPEDPRHSVRVVNAAITPLLNFGEQGAGEGQFQEPAGIATWGTAFTYTQVMTPDLHTLLLLHFDGNFNGAQGEVGIANGVSFSSGRHGQAALFQGEDTLTYPSAGNLERTQGSIEFWLLPTWDGNDNNSYIFLEVGEGWYNRLRIMKDGANNLRFMLWNLDSETSVNYHIGWWKAGEWHHIAALWRNDQIELFVDGVQVDQQPIPSPPASLGPTLYLGNGANGDLPAEARIDEFRISDLRRLGDSDSQGRILVADRGNHRLQAFDSLGNFLSAFGSQGSGIGQFNLPMGLVVDPRGRILVVDSGNGRLVALDFDGNQFSYQGTLATSLNNPTSLAVDDLGNTYIAETGANRILALDPWGVIRVTYTAPNDEYSGDFLAPMGVAVDPVGNLVVADTGNRRVVLVRAGALSKRLFLPMVER